MNKKSQIPATLTWFVGFIIIFFLIFLFTSATLFLVARKKAPVLALDNENGNFVLNEELISFLNTHVLIDGKTGTVTDLIFNVKEDDKYDKQLEEEMQKFVSVLNPECYIFRLDITRWGNPIGIINLFGYGGRGNSRTIQDSFIKEKGTTFLIPYKSGNVQIQLYSGECEL